MKKQNRHFCFSCHRLALSVEQWRVAALHLHCTLRHFNSCHPEQQQRKEKAVISHGFPHCYTSHFSFSLTILVPSRGKLNHLLCRQFLWSSSLGCTTGSVSEDRIKDHTKRGPYFFGEREILVEMLKNKIPNHNGCTPCKKIKMQ